jgi:hypothetical protein
MELDPTTFPLRMHTNCSSRGRVIERFAVLPSHFPVAHPDHLAGTVVAAVAAAAAVAEEDGDDEAGRSRL